MPTLLTILLTTLKEILLALVAKVAWKAIAERFITRAVVWGLKKLRDYSTNDVVDETLTDVINSLSGKRLHVIDNEIVK
ncbi:hypothetical protein AMBLS11_12435 [Alteromonas macleodii str. 'Black Sea 11']|nr:hypothetical protein AMBLS11_12435 [Alteromonas macleodii str. 'Black Sea 11']